MDNLNDLKKELGYEDGHNFTDDMVDKFSLMMPYLDENLVNQAIKNIPGLANFAVASLENMEKEYEATLNSVKESEDKVHSAYQESRQIYKEELKRDNLSEGARMHLWDLIFESANKEAEKDTEHKNFVFRLFNKQNGVRLALFAAAIFVGSQVNREKDSEQTDSEQTDKKKRMR